MTTQSIAATSIRWLINATWVQVALAFIYIPILIAWGLPISAASIVGNMVFPVFLITFLGLSALLFVGQIAGFTCTAIAWLLDYVTTWWLWALNFAHPNWLIGFIDPGLPILMAIAASGIVCVWLVRHQKAWFRLAIISGLLLAILAALKLLQQGPEQVELHYRGKNHTVVRDGTQVMVIMRSLHAPINSIDNWISFTLANTLYKRYGTNEVSELILINPSPSLEQAIAVQRPLRIGTITRLVDQTYARTLRNPTRTLAIDAHSDHYATIDILKTKQ